MINRYARGSGKTILNFANFLENCKNESKSEEDKIFFQCMKESWLEFNYGKNNEEN
jgi:hypothetical protein